MAKTGRLKEEQELAKLQERELDLFQHNKQVEEQRKRIQLERAESEATIPPMDDLAQRKGQRIHEEIATRRKIENTRREQNSGLILLIMLIAATAALVWWGITLMQGG